MTAEGQAVACGNGKQVVRGNQKDAIVHLQELVLSGPVDYSTFDEGGVV